MKHVIIGGDGFLGRHLAPALLERGESVLIASLQQSALALYARVPFLEVDITRPDQVARIPLEPDDVVYHFAARLLVPIMPRGERHAYFWSVNYQGTENVLRHVQRQGARRVVYFTTDMVYGHTQTVPKTEDHPRAAIGPYGASKVATEDLCGTFRAQGLKITIFRPRLIIGPGRLGILVKLFKLIDHNLPVPVIGNGRNHYQFISVYDCVSASLAAVAAGVPNEAYNLGSLNPPPVRTLLTDLINEAGSRSFVLPTPAWLVKRVLSGLDLAGWPLMDPEQYLIADETCVLDVTKAERDLGWRPQHDDATMLRDAYREYARGAR